jgi:hypothetical protein
VVADARIALDKGDITPVLKWLQAQDEKEVRENFARTLAVRKLDPEAQKLADTPIFSRPWCGFIGPARELLTLG